MKVVYVTGNAQKFEVAKLSFEHYGIELIQEKLDTPEIQSTSTEEIAAYSARWAANKLQLPVIVSDAGFYFNALNGFPGPFIKYVNNWFSAQDYINLLNGKSDRSVVVQGCYGFCEPGCEPVVFKSEAHGTIALKPGKKGNTPINELFIPEGYDRVESEIDDEEMNKFWAQHVNGWLELVELLRKKYSK